MPLFCIILNTFLFCLYHWFPVVIDSMPQNILKQLKMQLTLNTHAHRWICHKESVYPVHWHVSFCQQRSLSFILVEAVSVSAPWTEIQHKDNTLKPILQWAVTSRIELRTVLSKSQQVSFMNMYPKERRNIHKTHAITPCSWTLCI